MKRREFIGGTGTLLTAAWASGARADDDAAAIKQLINDCYVIFYSERDEPKYRSLLTEDYILLEKGEILDVEGDLAMMPAPGSDYKRTDTFDFRTVKVHGDIAYVVYVVKSEITNTKKVSQNGAWQWLESAIVRRSRKRWRIALLHSTQITKSNA